MNASELLRRIADETDELAAGFAACGDHPRAAELWAMARGARFEASMPTPPTQDAFVFEYAPEFLRAMFYDVRFARLDAKDDDQDDREGSA